MDGGGGKSLLLVALAVTCILIPFIACDLYYAYNIPCAT